MATCSVGFKGLSLSLRALSLASVQSRTLVTSPALYAGGKYRFAQGKAINNSSYGPLTDLPDYTYLDGRPTELGICQSKRRDARINTAERVVTLIKELKEAQQKHQEKLALKENETQQILQNHLKAKPLHK